MDCCNASVFPIDWLFQTDFWLRTKLSHQWEICQQKWELKKLLYCMVGYLLALFRKFIGSMDLLFMICSVPNCQVLYVTEVKVLAWSMVSIIVYCKINLFCFQRLLSFFFVNLMYSWFLYSSYTEPFFCMLYKVHLFAMKNLQKIKKSS